MNAIKRAFAEIKKYPSAMAGVALISLLVVLAVYALISIPYTEAITLWRGADNIWIENPRNARPVWVNYFSRAKMPETMIFRSKDNPEVRTILEDVEGFRADQIVFEFDYQYDGFPTEISLFMTSTFEDIGPYVTITWVKPDGTTRELTSMGVVKETNYRISQDERLTRQLGGLLPERGLFADPENNQVPLKGTYKMIIEGLVFEEDSDYDANLIVYGQLHGMAGTDHRRRDISVALLWGTPVALAFGLLAAVGSTVTTMIIAAASVWYGGWIDSLIRRITEVVMILPLLPILIMISLFYSQSIWVILGVIILLGIFGSGILTYRSMFLQIKESGYIDAARAYGASSFRIVIRYMIPKIFPVLVPQFVTLVPSYVFLEASLAVLGLSDPLLPTWGKLLNDAYANGALYKGYFYWVLEPAALLMITGLGFAMLGFALDRIFNPRLRGL